MSEERGASGAETVWQQTNRERIEQRVAALRRLEDGTLFATTWGGQHVVVTKSEERLRLWLLPEESGATEWVQSDLDLARPLRLAMGYAQAMTLALLWRPDPVRVFVAGVGGGCLPLVLHHHLPRLALDCVEIAPPVVQIAGDLFPLRADERLSVTTGDAGAFLEAETDASYDILFLDLFTGGGSTPAHLASPEFYQTCRDRMDGHGVVTANLGSAAADKTALIQQLRALFGTVRICRIHRANAVVYATDAPALSRFELMQRAVAIQQQQQFHFPFAAWVSRMDESESVG